jgi:hypothetical protein
MRLVATRFVSQSEIASPVDPEPGVDTGDPTTPTAAAAEQVVEIPYVELAGRLPATDLAVLADDAGFVMAMGKRATAGTSYNLYTAAGVEPFEKTGTGDWCGTALVVEAATKDPAETAFTLSGATDLEDVVVGSAALWGAELVRVDAIDADAGTVTLGRACGDTVPQVHGAGERIWFYDDGASSDTREYADGEVVHAKLLTKTASEELPIGDAADLTVTMDSRQARPYPPADFQLEGAVPDGTALTETITVSWAHRDRVLQADQLLDTTEASVGPESGTSYSLQVIDDTDDSVILEATNLAGPSVDVLLADDYAGGIRIELWSVRDGLASWQRQVSPAFAYTRGAEGDAYVIANPGSPGMTDGDTAPDPLADYFAIAEGTGDAMTATLDPAPDLVDGAQIYLRAPGANTISAPTVELNGGDALEIFKFGGDGLDPGDIAQAGHEIILRYVANDGGTPFWELINPAGTSVELAITITDGDVDHAPTADAVHDALALKADAATLAAHIGAGGAAHANVVAGGNAGFMTGADKTKLDGITAGATA